MNFIERWFVKRIVAKAVVQGYNHKRNIEDLYRVIDEAVEKEFTEDTCATRYAFTRECFERAQAS